MRRKATEDEIKSLKRKAGRLPPDTLVQSSMAESLHPSLQKEGFVHCVWHRNCEYCRKADGTWVLMRCV